MLDDRGRIGRKRRWLPAFKLAAVSRMSEGENVQALSEELSVRAALLYDWHRRYRVGGAEALRPMGRPSSVAPAFEPTLALAPLPSPDAEQRRIQELERKIGQQQLDWIFFVQPCGMSGRSAGRTALLAGRDLRGDPRADAAARL